MTLQPDTIQSEIQSLAPSALIELFVLDLAKQGGGVFHFHTGTNELSGDVVWQGQTYSRFPIEATGFDKRSTGALPRPVVKVSNAQGLMGAQARQFGYFLGCRFIRKRTFARFLDAVNFAAGNPQADPNQALPDDIWIIDRKANENPTQMEFELASALDMQGVALPRRQMIQNCCAWVYRSPECGYAGGAVAKEDGTATADLMLDLCGKRLTDCKLRFGSGVLPYGGFPGCGLVQ
ncbi:phage minor tail protein L [Undibacterium sp. Rencai35W]|uniref:phage minor tail protein L n=1 Tax=Undibacterium sp. Rencai35W TaxID=3413046 RepID=UPI003BF3A466